MRRALLAASFAVFVCLIAGRAESAEPAPLTEPAVQPARPASPAPVTIAWQPDLRTAHRVSKQTGRPMLLVFGASWCGYCRKLEQETLGDPRMAAYVNAAFVPVRVDLDRDRKAAEFLQVEAVPATIVLTPGVELLARHDGYAPVAPYAQVLEQARETYLRQSIIQPVSAAQPK